MPADPGRHSVQTGLVAVVLMVGVAFAIGLTLSSSENEKQAVVETSPLVTVMEATRRDVPVKVRGNGTVGPSVTVHVVPQVAGMVLEVHPTLRAGGFFKAGETLVRIDAIDYELDVQAAEAEVTQARATMENASAIVSDFEARLADAQIELARQRELRQQHSTSQRELDRAELALKGAEAQLLGAKALKARDAGAAASARTQLRIANVKLARTRIAAPFNGRVLSEQVDVGQFVSTGESLAAIYSTSAMEVVVPLEDWQLAWFDAPHNGRTGSGHGSPARVRADFAGRDRTWPGHVSRLGEIDAVSRMVNVVVEVVEPNTQDKEGVTLAPGMFVQVEIEGRTASDVFVIPRRALRRNGKVWVVEDGTLRFRDVQIVRFERDVVYVRGLDGERPVITSALDIVTDTMRVQTAPKPPAANDPAAPAADGDADGNGPAPGSAAPDADAPGFRP